MTQYSSKDLSSNTNRKVKVDRRVLKTKKSLFDAYEQLLSDPDVRRITISSLTREAGVDRKTFYLHYSSIDDMVDDMVDDLVGRIMGHLMAILDSQDHQEFLVDVEEFFNTRTILICEEFSTTIKENPVVVRHLFECSAMGSLVGRFREPMVQDAIAYCDLPEDRLNLYATYTLGSIISCYHLWLTTDIGIDIEELGTFIADLVARGLSHYLQSRIEDLGE